MKYDVAIIGGGLGALECASLLSRKGRSVVVLEQGTQLGGCIQSYRRGDYTFDTGLHYVGGIAEGESLHKAFKAFNLLSLPWQQLRQDSFDRVTICGDSYDFCQGFDNFACRMKSYFPDESAAIDGFVNLLQCVTEDALPAHSAHITIPSFIQELIATNAWQYLERTFSNPRLIDVLSGTSLKMELRRKSLPLFTFLHTLGGYIQSSWKLKGSGHLIVDRLTNDIHLHGGTTECNSHIVRLDVRDGLVRAAIDDKGEAYEATIFISDIHPAATCQLLNESNALRKSYIKRMNECENTFGFFTVSLVMKPKTMPYHSRNQYVYSCGDVWTIHENPSDVNCVMISETVPTDGTEYTSQVDLLTPMSWCNVEQWLGTHPFHRGDKYKQLKRQWAEKCISLAASQLPEITSYEKMFTSTPLTWHNYTLTPQGSAYGMRKDSEQPLFIMLSERTPIPNLMLTGQNLALHGVQGVSMTALKTCQTVMEHKA